jgi:hypothetical protein
MIVAMNTILEIESAIERLPEPQVAELATWLEQFRQRQAAQPPVDDWLKRARGVALPKVTTADVMALTRNDP